MKRRAKVHGTQEYASIEAYPDLGLMCAWVLGTTRFTTWRIGDDPVVVAARLREMVRGADHG